MFLREDSPRTRTARGGSNGPSPFHGPLAGIRNIPISDACQNKNEATGKVGGAKVHFPWRAGVPQPRSWRNLCNNRISPTTCELSPGGETGRRTGLKIRKRHFRNAPGLQVEMRKSPMFINSWRGFFVERRRTGTNRNE